MGLFDWLKKKNVSEQLQVVQATKKTNTETIEKVVNSDDHTLLDDLIVSAFPSSNGLYPHEILMLSYAHTYKTLGNTFQSFWKYQYSVHAPQDILTSLYNSGFIEIGDLRLVLNKLKVSELKDLLNENGQKTTGKKDELIERIIATCDKQQLEETYNERYYVLTNKGQEELLNNEYVIYLHRHQHMSVWEMNKRLFSNNSSGIGYRDILWGEFNRRSGEQFKNSDFGLYRNTRLSMSDFLREEKKYKKALCLLIEVASFDLSGLGNGDKPSLREYMPLDSMVRHKMVNLYSEDIVEIIEYPGIIKIFAELKELLAMTDSDYANFLYNEFAQIDIHERVFTATECANIILSQLGIEERAIKNSYIVAEERIRKCFAKK